jgi:hypothetical protein
MRDAIKTSLLGVLGLTAFLGGCLDTELAYTPLNAPPGAMRARGPDQVQLFSSAAPERPHIDVGLLSVTEGDGWETPATLIGKLRQAAADHGCDALVLAPPGTKESTDVLGVRKQLQLYSGTCVVYR